MAEFIKNSPFRFWCQKVLPLVYDDSLSYYELLCKVVGKLNELAENQNNLSDEIKAVANDLNDFKTQVPGMIEAKVEEWLNNYITTHGLVNSVNGMTGVVTLTAADVGAIANVNGSVKNNNIADGAVTTEKIADGSVTGDKIAGKAITANKLADGVIPEKLPNPQKLTFTGAVTGEYDGSQAVNIDIPAGGGGGGGGAVDSVNGMTGAVVLKKLTAGEGLSMSGADGYNGSAEQSVGIAPGGVTADKLATGVVPDKLPNPQKLTFTGAVSAEYDGSQEITVNIPSVQSIEYSKTYFDKTIGGAKVRFEMKYRPRFDLYLNFSASASIPVGTYTITYTLPSKIGSFSGVAALLSSSTTPKVCGACLFQIDGTTLKVHINVEEAGMIRTQIYMLYYTY